MRVCTLLALGLGVFFVPNVYSQDFKAYFGNLHSHTSYSDGSGTPHEAYRHAREAGKLDFLAITEHNHKSAESGAGERRDGILIAKDPTLYNGPDAFSLVETAKRMTEDGKFIALYGQEFSSISKGNHVVVLDAPKVIDVTNGRFDQLLTWLTANPDTTGSSCIVQFNHPKLFNKPSEYGKDDFPSQQQWIASMGAVTHLIEVLNGPAMTKTGGERPDEVAENDYKTYLRLGFKLAPTADQDNHYFTWGTATDARTGVVIDGPINKAKLLDGLRHRHVYASQDKNLSVIAKINGQLCGDEVLAPPVSSILAIELVVSDPDEPNASYNIEVLRGTVGGAMSDIVETFVIDGDDNDPGAIWTIDNIQYTGGHQFFYFKLTQHDEDGHEDNVWTAPVWFNPGGLAPVVAGETPAGDSVVASRRSNVFHTSTECEFAQKISASNRLSGAEAKQGRRQCLKCKELESGGN